MSIIQSDLLLGQEGSSKYQVSRSLRFDAASTSYLSRTPGSAGTRTTYTLSVWVKRAALSTRQMIFSANNGGDSDAIYFHEDNTLRFFQRDGLDSSLITTQVFRDASAWYHIVLAVDTTQGTSSNRVKIYVNGTQVTTFSTASYPSSSYTGGINNTVAHNIGRRSSASDNYLDAYLADAWFLDGIAATPSDFAETDATTGQWSPKAYAGSKPGNSFHLDFSDNSAATAAALGKDSSGNGLNWSPNNFSVTGTVNHVTSGLSYRKGARFSNWDSSSADSTPSSSVSADNYWWVDLGSSKTFNKIQVTDVISGSSLTQFYFLASTSSSSSGTEYCASGCAGYAAVSTAGSAPGTVNVVFSGFGNITARYIAISQGYSSTNVYSNLKVLDDQGKDNDSLRDTPVSSGIDTGLGNEVTGNYCTWNPLAKNSALNLANGNLDDSTGTPGIDGIGLGTIGASVGKFYWELTVNSTSGGNNPIIGVVPTSAGLIEVGSNNANSVGYLQSGSKRINGSTTSYGNSFTTGDVVGVALDLDNGAIYFSKNGTWQNSGVPTSGSSKTGAAHTWTGGSVEMTPAIREYNSSCSANWGQRSWAYAAPSGFKALCDTNLTAPVIAKPNTVMDVKLYTGNGGTPQTISGLNFEADLLWFANRTTAGYLNPIIDQVRGLNKYLTPYATNAESTNANMVTATSSTGFTVGSSPQVNDTSQAMVTWLWDAGTTTTTINANAYSAGVPSITTSVRANPSAGFSVVTGTTPATNTFSCGHGLNAEPHFIIVKVRNQAYNWDVYHKSLGNTGRLIFNNSNASSTSANAWGSTTPTSSVFTMGGNGTWYSSGDQFVAYAWAPVTGLSSFGAYQGNGSTDGPFVYTGFRPRWVMIKRVDNAPGAWTIIDTSRDTYNVSKNRLRANDSAAEDGVWFKADLVSNGFKLRDNDQEWNLSERYIYAAFAENPFQYARAR